MQINIKKLPKSEVEIEGEMEADVFEGYYSKAIKHIGENFEADGFRKGKVPENILLTKVPEIRVLEEMAEMALGENYPKILEENKIDAISRPEISITKLARKNPLGFKIKTSILPEIKMADYKKIAKEILSSPPAKGEVGGGLEVSDEELEKVILDIRKSRAAKVEEPLPDPLLDKERVPEAGEVKELEPILPELNDEFVKGMGPFENVEDFRKKLRENMKLEKENALKEKTRIKIIEKIIEKSEMEVPEVLIELETNKILYKMEADVAQMGLKFEDYLKHLKKSVEDLRADFKKDSEQRAKLALILSEISKLENIKPEEKDIEHEVEHILEHYKEADPARVQAHAENVLTNEKVFAFLEAQ